MSPTVYSMLSNAREMPKAMYSDIRNNTEDDFVLSLSEVGLLVAVIQRKGRRIGNPASCTRLPIHLLFPPLS